MMSPDKMWLDTSEEQEPHDNQRPRIVKAVELVPSFQLQLRFKEPFPVVYKFEGVWYRFWISAGWVYDVASVPRIFWPIIGPVELGYEATASHDWLIEKKGKVIVDRWSPTLEEWVTEAQEVQMSRREVDEFLAMKMRARQVSKPKRRIAFIGVRSCSLFKQHILGDEWWRRDGRI